MNDSPRRSPYAWATWFTGHLAGDDDCLWAPWYKAHHQYEKRTDDDRVEQLARWKAEHADMVRARAAGLEADGWSVFVEGQNKMTIRGRALTLGGTPDIVAIRDGEALVEECKTGKRRDSDYWQVVTYLCFVTETHPEVDKGAALSGAVVYGGGRVEVSDPDEQKRARVIEMLRRLGGHAPPDRVPSARECRFCDVAACPDRVTEDNEALTLDF